MKKTISFLLLLPLFLFASINAEEEKTNRWYVDFQGGVNFSDFDFYVQEYRSEEEKISSSSAGYFAAASLGYKLSSRTTLETELSYRYNQFDIEAASAHESKVSLLENVLFDFPIIGKYFAPYFGIGIGWAYDICFLNWDKDMQFYNKLNKRREWGPAYQGIAGVNFNLGKKSDIGIEYRYYNNYAFEDQNQTLGFNFNLHF